jgi:hypothetical protein
MIWIGERVMEKEQKEWTFRSQPKLSSEEKMSVWEKTETAFALGPQPEPQIPIWFSQF